MRMSRKRCHRKHYALVDPIRHAITGAAITPDSALATLRLRELSAVEAFRTGRATRDDWMALADLSNVAETMARDGVGRDEVLPVCERVQEALGAAHDRYKAGGRLGLDGPGLQAARDLAEYHQLQRTSVCRAEYERAIKRTADRIKSAAADVKVYIG
jgi:hypothetical protein